ncbi:hypothetical protein [Xanthocytophaga agilis]|uniref:Uncharacterized protein n=1 Tax=Xanthocytophaga agilis TaxID=3048010 RepID=A0AAE3R8P9_9BACT|nr:hypothetical protein [Xanthocytophaga agilis]MDJ1503499.1 hypothetical protein [Xanthocytophaga agilis]
MIIDKVYNTDNPLEWYLAYRTLYDQSSSSCLSNLIDVCLVLQGNKIYWQVSADGDNDAEAKLEDNRNTFVATVLEAKGYFIKDQTRWSRSNTGKAPGEIDIFIRDKNKRPLSIIEALNLDSLKEDYLKLHIDKLFKYDTTGLEHNFILVYVTAKKFDSFSTNYLNFIEKHIYKYSLMSVQEENYEYTDIKVFKATHLRNGKEIVLYHILLNLYH